MRGGVVKNFSPRWLVDNNKNCKKVGDCESREIESPRQLVFSTVRGRATEVLIDTDPRGPSRARCRSEHADKANGRLELFHKAYSRSNGTPTLRVY
jgi:hypothetical protein